MSDGIHENRENLIKIIELLGLPMDINGFEIRVSADLKLSSILTRLHVAMYALKSIKLHEISLLKLRQHLCLYKSSLICTWRHYSRQVCTSGMMIKVN